MFSLALSFGGEPVRSWMLSQTCNRLKRSKSLAVPDWVPRCLLGAQVRHCPPWVAVESWERAWAGECGSTKETYLSQKVCRQGRTLGFLYRSRHILQIRNCLSIWRTTGLGMLAPSLAILDHWHGGPAVLDPARCCSQREKPKGKHMITPQNTCTPILGSSILNTGRRGCVLQEDVCWV